MNKVRACPICLHDKYLHVSGSMDYLLDQSGLSIDLIVSNIKKYLKSK